MGGERGAETRARPVEAASPVPRGGKWEGRTGTSRRGGRRGRRGGEDRCRGQRGPGQKGRWEAGKGAGNSSLGPRRSRLPSRLRSAPPLGPAPAPQRTPPQRRVRGNTLLGGLLVPEQVSGAAYAFPEPWRPVPSAPPASPPGTPARARKGPRILSSAVPNQGPRSQET